jgi:DNA repair exonuclease SbcCD nuclease subunit
MWFADKTDISSLYPLEAVPGVHIIRRPLSHTIAGLKIDFLPFTLNPLVALEEFTGNQSRVLCGHLSLDGAQLNTFYKTRADVSVEHDGDMVKVDSAKFTGWDKVFLGHYHGEQRIGNIEYIGSPLQLNFAEAFQQKHTIVLDTDTLQQEYVINDFSPRHLILEEDQLAKFNLNNTFIRLTCKDLGSSDLMDMRDQLMEEHNILSLELTPPKSDEDEGTKTEIADAHNILVQDRAEMLVQYMNVAGIPEDLDFDKLLNIGKDICTKSQME